MRPVRFNQIVKPALLLIVAMVAQGQTPANVYRVVNLVSNSAGVAAATDPNLVDPWGIANPSTFWVSDHGDGLTTLYSGLGVASSTVVTIPAAPGGTVGKPTGQVQNSQAAAFTLTNGGSANFIFATEDGLLTAWNGAAGKLSEVKVDNSAKKAVYKGLAIGTSAAGGTLYGANFRSGKVDTWGPGYAPVTLAGSFTDPAVPAGYAPFNIWNLNNTLYVEYAKQDANQFLDVGGAGNGYVAAFDQNGNLIQHLVSNGPLNSPWGVAIAPANWGAFGGALLVGNFGDGHINAFNATTGAFLGALQDSNGNPLAISGLWGLLFGAGTRSDPNALYFVAGIPDGSSIPRGLFGTVAPPSAITAVVNAASWLAGPVAPGEIVAIGGQTVGPAVIASATIPATGSIGTTLGSTTVTVNGIPAPIIYASGAETSIQVPDSIVPSPFSQGALVSVQTPGQTSQSFYVPLALAAPGLFASNSSGTGQLAALNSNGTVNTATNAAAGGTTITVFATGAGFTAPPSIDGTIPTTPWVPTQPVSLSIGGQTAQGVTARTPVGTLSGVIAITATVPTGLTPGPVPVVLTIGTVSTTQTVTISVK